MDNGSVEPFLAAIDHLLIPSHTSTLQSKDQTKLFTCCLSSNYRRLPLHDAISGKDRGTDTFPHEFLTAVATKILRAAAVFTLQASFIRCPDLSQTSGAAEHRPCIL